MPRCGCCANGTLDVEEYGSRTCYFADTGALLAAEAIERAKGGAGSDRNAQGCSFGLHGNERAGGG